MKVIGLTGNIASGKSSVSKILQELGAVVIDMDSLGKALQDSNYKGVIQKIEEAFGSKVITNGKLDRKALANIVFHDKEKLKILNDIMIPLMTEKLKEKLNELRDREVIVIDAAMLFEAGWDKFADTIWVVYVPKDIQIKRLLDREHIDLQEALARIEAQMPIEEKMKRATAVIENSGNLEDLRKKVIELWKSKIIST